MNIQKNLRLVQVNTTAWDEEDFLLLTTLLDFQIESVLEPIVTNERENNVEYDNDKLVEALRIAYPRAIIMHHPIGSIDLLSI